MTHVRRSSTLKMLGALLLAVLLTSACSPKKDEEMSALPDKDRLHWRMPLDDFHSVRPQVVDYATNLLLRPCLEKAAIEIPALAPVTFNSPPLPTENAAGRRIFNSSVAPQFGYRLARHSPLVVPSAAASAALDTPEGQEALNQCLEGVRRRVPEPPNTRLLSSSEAVSYDAALASERVTTANEKWRACMAPVGLADLPNLPGQMPPPSVATRFGIEEDVYGRPSKEEIDLAVADARCRESAGWDAALYEAEWAEQVRALEEHRVIFDQIKEENAEFERQVRDVLQGGA